MFNIIQYDSVESTNETAKELIKKNGLNPFTVIFAQEQTKGKGQRGNTWLSQNGANITCSIVCNIKHLVQQNMFALIACVAKSCHQYLQTKLLKNAHDLKIKWVNDLYYQDKKLGGILIENIFHHQQVLYSIIGIGLNINQTLFESHISNKATSIKLINNEENDYNLSHELTNLLNLFYDNFISINEHKKSIMTYYNEHLYKRNEVQMFKHENDIFEALVLRCEANGKIILNKNAQEQSFDFGTLEYLI